MNNQYAGRLSSLQKYLKEKDVNLAVITSPINIFYFTGFLSNPHERFMALVVSSEGQVELLVPSLDCEAAEETSYVRSIIPIKDTDSPYSILQGRIGSSVIRTLGVEKNIISQYRCEQLTTIFPQAGFADIEPFIMSLRSRKSYDEIQCVKKAVRVIEKVMDNGLNKFVRGMTELELTAEIEYQMRLSGASGPAFSPIVLSGPRSALPHGQPGMRHVQENDLLLLDIGVFVDGYCSDITRTFIVGEGTRDQITLYHTVLEANQKALEAVVVGQPLGSLDRAARGVIETEGYGAFFTHRVGHGMGLEVHEVPSIHEQNNVLIEPGLLFTIEPGIYIPHIGGIRIEDDVYIHEDGSVEVLTTYPKELKHI